MSKKVTIDIFWTKKEVNHSTIISLALINKGEADKKQVEREAGSHMAEDSGDRISCQVNFRATRVKSQKEFHQGEVEVAINIVSATYFLNHLLISNLSIDRFESD